jgi:hypothetical protein
VTGPGQGPRPVGLASGAGVAGATTKAAEAESSGVASGAGGRQASVAHAHAACVSAQSGDALRCMEGRWPPQQPAGALRETAPSPDRCGLQHHPGGSARSSAADKARTCRARWYMGRPRLYRAKAESDQEGGVAGIARRPPPALDGEQYACRPPSESRPAESPFFLSMSCRCEASGCPDRGGDCAGAAQGAGRFSTACTGLARPPSRALKCG